MSLAGTFIRNFYRPSFWTDSVAPWTIETAVNGYFDHLSRGGFDIMAEDWDNCIIIDACRFDMFREQNSIPGRLEHRRSKGSTTFEFFEENFLGSTYHDTVYVTANPVPRVEKWCRVNLDAVFYKVVDIWEDHWDEDLNSVLPAPVKTAIKDAHSNHPDKRILGHFIQPHQPFIGPTGKQIEQRGMRAYDLVKGSRVDSRKTIWDQLKAGDIKAEVVWQAYRENLDIVLPHIETLCDELIGKTIVTSDHGNMIGDLAWPFPIRQYGHPPGIHTKKLVKVPWLEIESDTRREIVSEPPVQSEPVSDEQEQLKRLSALGYR